VKTLSCTAKVRIATANIRNREERRPDTWLALVPRERHYVQVFGETSVKRKGDEGRAGRQKARDDATGVASSIPTARPNATSATKAFKRQISETRYTCTTPTPAGTSVKATKGAITAKKRKLLLKKSIYPY